MDGTKSKTENLFLGFDFSTQQVKAIAITENLQVKFEEHIQFDVDLPSYRTHGGVHIHEKNHKIVTAPTLMWVEALDLLLGKMKKASFPFHKVVALSGDAQQCSSVYWKRDSKTILQNLTPEKSISEQLQNCFSIPESPEWMDASTTEQCHQLEDKVGGPQKLSDITGAKAMEGFTGNQIMKLFQTNREVYDQTERISLVSSFAASLFLGDYAPIDYSDGSAMDLMNIWTKDWSPQCLEACGDHLADKLGKPVKSSQNIGNVSNYMVARYGFSPECIIAAFIGDNPATLAGIAPQKGDVIFSMGTSDCGMGWLSDPHPGLDGYVLVNPIDAKDFMSLFSFKNGSLVRERIRNEQASGSWDVFNEMLNATPPGNNGNIGIYFDVAEFKPIVEGTFRFDDKGNKVSSFPPKVEVRAVLESQFMARRLRCEAMGLKLGPKKRVLATGGASQNKAILQVLSDVFNTPVYVKDVPNSALLGSALRAKHTWINPEMPFAQILDGHGDEHVPVLVASPRHLEEIYSKLCQRYQELENFISENC